MKLTERYPVIPTIVDKWSLCVEIIPVSYFRVTNRTRLNRITAAIVSLLWLGTTFLAIGCAGPKSAGEFRVGLVTPGSIDDAAWNSGAYRGLQEIRDSLQVQISQVEARTPSEQEEALRTYAAQGFNLVFAHGFEFQGLAERVSAQYPKTVFIVTSGERVSGNVSPLIFRLYEASYLAGIVAGGMTKTGGAAASGAFGDVRMINALNYTDYMYRPRRPEELDTAQGGGVVFSQGAHQIDIVRLLGGGKVHSVRAATGAWDPSRPTEGAYAAFLTFDNGAFATVTYSGFAHFDSDEFCDWTGEMGLPKDRGGY